MLWVLTVALDCQVTVFQACTPTNKKGSFSDKRPLNWTARMKPGRAKTTINKHLSVNSTPPFDTYYCSHRSAERIHLFNSLRDVSRLFKLPRYNAARILEALWLGLMMLVLCIIETVYIQITRNRPSALRQCNKQQYLQITDYKPKTHKYVS